MNESHESSDCAVPFQSTCCGGGWKFPLLLLAVLAVVLITGRFGMQERKAETPSGNGIGAEAASQTVSLTIDSGDGRQREWPALAWRDGMTVADALAAVRSLTRQEPIDFAQMGSGDKALLTELAQLGNEGAGGRNWTYQVNGKRADRSFAVYQLQPGDRVLWRFGKPE
jgi:hypothetical protein